MANTVPSGAKTHAAGQALQQAGLADHHCV